MPSSSPSTPAVAAIAEVIASRFSTPFYRHHAKWKLRLDPLYVAVGDLLEHTSLPVLDVGCGTGLMSLYLHERGVRVPLHGMDFDGPKIRAAQGAASGLEHPPHFHHMDVRTEWPDVQGHVCVLDVLQYLPAADQQTLLTRTAHHVAPGGELIIRSGLRDDSWRYRFTLWTDRVMNLARLMKSPPVHYPAKEELVHALAQAGVRLTRLEPLHQGTPFNNYLLLFQRQTPDIPPDHGRTQR